MERDNHGHLPLILYREPHPMSYLMCIVLAFLYIKYVTFCDKVQFRNMKLTMILTCRICMWRSMTRSTWLFELTLCNPSCTGLISDGRIVDAVSNLWTWQAGRLWQIMNAELFHTTIGCLWSYTTSLNITIHQRKSVPICFIFVIRQTASGED